MSTATNDRNKVLENRHEFILQYYNMAAQDLDRHLKIGWQTIAVVAGAIASISLGEQGHLPIFVSVSAALVVLFWGLQNVIDANYWALRAIAFLANVEAVYFSLIDTKYFNPYAGRHPPYKLMNSLRYQFSVCIILIAGISIFFGYKLLLIAGDWPGLRTIYAKSGFFKILVWQLPIFITLYYTSSILYILALRYLDYRNFVQSSPGPGMVSELAYLRNVDLSPDSGDTRFVEGSELQTDTLTKLQKHVGKSKFIRKWHLGLFGIAVLALLAINFCRAQLFV